MDTNILKIVGKIAGIGGLALGVFLIIYKEVLRNKFFSKLNSDQSYLIIRLLILLTWSLAVIGLLAWLLNNNNSNNEIIDSSAIINKSSDSFTSSILVEKLTEFEKENQRNHLDFLDILNGVHSDMFRFHTDLITKKNIIINKYQLIEFENKLNLNYLSSIIKDIKSVKHDIIQIELSMNNLVSILDQIQISKELRKSFENKLNNIKEIEEASRIIIKESKTKLKNIISTFSNYEKLKNVYTLRESDCKYIGFACMNVLLTNNEKLNSFLKDLQKMSYLMTYTAFRKMISQENNKYSNMKLKPLTLLEPISNNMITYTNIDAVNNFHNQVNKNYKSFLKEISNYNNACFIVFPIISRKRIDINQKVNNLFVINIIVYNFSYNSASRRVLIIEENSIYDFVQLKEKIHIAIIDSLQDIM